MLAGNSIGATFKAHGWEVRKQTQFIGQISLQHADPSIAEAMRVEPARDVAMHGGRLPTLTAALIRLKWS